MIFMCFGVMNIGEINISTSGKIENASYLK